MKRNNHLVSQLLLKTIKPLIGSFEASTLQAVDTPEAKADCSLQLILILSKRVFDLLASFGQNLVVCKRETCTSQRRRRVAE